MSIARNRIQLEGRSFEVSVGPPSEGEKDRIWIEIVRDGEHELVWEGPILDELMVVAVEDAARITLLAHRPELLARSVTDMTTTFLMSIERTSEILEQLVAELPAGVSSQLEQQVERLDEAVDSLIAFLSDTSGSG